MDSKINEEGAIFLVDKPKGWTSFDVVAKIRSAATQHFNRGNKKRLPVGHAGTLDPFATGLLIVLVGKETKNQDHYLKQDKEYLATLELGKTSTTGDPEGEIIPFSKAVVPPKEEEIKKVLSSFVGEQEQRPPKFSAIKIKGQKAYDLARAGKEFELKKRSINILGLELRSYEWPQLALRVNCSSGTYVRTLAEDIGKALETGAYLTELRRTKIGDFEVLKAQSVDEVLLDLKG